MGAPGGRNHPQTQDILMTTDDAAIALKWFLVSFGQRLCFDQWSVISFDIEPLLIIVFIYVKIIVNIYDNSNIA